MKKYQNQRRLFATVIISVLGLLVLILGVRVGSAYGADPALAPVIEQIEASGSYAFVAQVEQTLLPRPVPVNVGKTEERVDTQLVGEITLPDFASVTLEFEVGAGMPPLTLEQDGLETYLIQNGERTQIENPLGMMPATDFVGYLESAENIQQTAHPDRPDLKVITFDINGEKYANYVATTLSASGNGQLAPAAMLRNMSGQVELWVDDNGYPQRQIIDTFMPEVDDVYDVRTRSVVDFTFEKPLTGVALPAIGADAVHDVPAAQPEMLHDAVSRSVKSAVPGALAVIVALSLTLVLLFPNRFTSKAVPVSLAAILLFTPVLQSVAFSQSAEESVPTLIEALGVEQSAAEESETLATLPPTPERQAVANTATCGTGDTAVDSDGDGLSDFVENCLGTSVTSTDTDLDGIIDPLEVNGFVFTNTLGITTTIYTNPHEADSNRDGMYDSDEWPYPIGNAPEVDPDGDDLPNIWDRDNDGDGIEDKDDLDPFTATPYQASFVLQTSLNEDPYDGYQYIEFQVQPQDETHFQLATTELDWPYDEKGTLQARDVARDDELIFRPMLKIKTNDVPTGALREMYGVTLVESPGRDTLYIDLSPVSSGGMINGFQGRVVYAPGQIDDINWSDVQFVWTAMMKHTPATASDPTDYIYLPVAEYAEAAYRFAGLEVTKAGALNYAVIGTPGAQTDHRQLVNLVTGLDLSYLRTVNPGFDEIVTRFSDPTTPITQTWGVPISEIAIAEPWFQPSHPDEALTGPGNTYRTVTNFLADNGYDTSQVASLIMIAETEVGATGFDATAQIGADGRTLSVNLADVPLLKQRTMTLTHYQHNGTRWGELDPTDALSHLTTDYAGDPAAAVAALQHTYPDITELDLAMALSAFYLDWMYGDSSTILYDDVPLVGETEPIDTLNALINLPTATDTLTYLIEAYQLGVVGGSVVFNNAAAFDAYNNTSDLMSIGTSIGAGAFALVGYSYGTYRIFAEYEKIGFRDVTLRANGIKATAEWLFGYKVAQESIVEEPVLIKNEVEGGVTRRDSLSSVDSDVEFDIERRSIAQAQELGEVGEAVDNASLAKKSFKKGVLGHWTKTGNFIIKYARVIAKVLIVFDIVTSIIDITFAWVNYAKFSSPFQFEKTAALVYAIVQTLYIIVLFALGFAGFGVPILLLFLVIDLLGLIISSILGRPIDSVVTTYIAKAFFQADQLTRLGSIDFEGLDVGINRSGYALAGSTITLRDQFHGRIDGYINLDRIHLESSDAYGTMQARATGDTGVMVTAENDIGTRLNRCYIISGNKYCTNNLWAEATFPNAGRDQLVELFYSIYTRTRYDQYTFGFKHKNPSSNEINMPADLPAEDQWGWLPLYFDILPATLDGLLNWDELFNADVDGDDILDYADGTGYITPGLPLDIDGDGLTNPYDRDRDGDMLSDGFERASNNSLGTDLNQADSDGDGLNDGTEYALQSALNKPDTDSDGLSDGDEWYHYDGSAWTGGGWFIDIAGTNYWVFADPFNGDLDGDGINDGSEKNNGTSPRAVNSAPRFEVDAGPLMTSPNGTTGIYVKAGDTVTSTVNLYNIGAGAIDETLTYCVPADLSNVQVTATGDRVPATQQSGNCYSWDFSSSNLLLFQSFNIAMSATATGATITDTLSASLPISVDGAVPQPLTVNLPFFQDNSAPTVQLTDPLSNTILTSDFYVMGGFAQDATSWIDSVDVTVHNGTYSANLDDAQWLYTWELPDDGIVTLSAVAYDALGNASAPASVQVTVDTLAPAITTNLINGATISSTAPLSTTFFIDGTATDNFAGVERVQLKRNRGPWTTIWEDVTPSISTSWSGEWTIPTIGTAQGAHTLYLRAFDAYGNSDTITQTVFLDILPPTNDLTSRAFIQSTPEHVPGGQPVPLTGVASDAGNNPLPADPTELTGNLDSIEDATVWLQIDNLSDNDSGAVLNWIGDVNGDRLGDLAVGLPGANGGTGKVVVITGRPGDWPSPNIDDLEFLRDNTPSYIGTAGAGIGAIIKPAGDVNGDGLDDLLLGDPANDRVVLILGSAQDGVFEQTIDGAAPRQIELLTQATGESLSAVTATQVAGVGDVNDDGLGDIMVTVATLGGSRVYLLVGDLTLLTPQGLDTLGAAYLDVMTSNVSIAGVGDINDDFVDDFAIALDGTIYLFAGGTSWTRASLTELTTVTALTTFASAETPPTIVATGDINGDGIDDFAYSSGSNPVVVFGDASNSFATQTLGGFGAALSGFLAAVGDVDKDGRGDLLVGNADGDAYLIAGSNLASAAATITGVATSANATYLAGSDLAGDGSADIALIPSASEGYDNFGAPGTHQPFISRDWLPAASGSAQAQSAQPRSLVSADVTVAPIGGDYTSIQAAIDSGATRVLIKPGVYREVITLTTGVSLIGSGAELTILTFPPGSTPGTLVTVDGVADAALQNMTLLGDAGVGIGIAVRNGATNIRLERTVVQEMATAISVDGAASTLTVKNNTIVGNIAGFVASNNAGVNVRNTILAFNTGTALQYDAGAVLQLNQYNLYYANGVDQSPNNPGGGELFSDPLFLDYANNDFRTEVFSPVIDAGEPNDPVPPGAGSAADIGHLEQTGSSFFVDDDYCDVCINDGLIWGVDAFDTVQAAVDVAQADLELLRPDAPVQFTVGVNPGTYTETVVISTSVRLLGASPDATTLIGNGGPAVTFDAAVNAGVSQMTLTGGGANPIGLLLAGGSNTIDIDYNLIKDNTTGISVTQRSTGSATFNTIISNTTGVEIARGIYRNFITYTDPLLIDPIVTFAVYGDACLDPVQYGYDEVRCEDRGFIWLDMANNIVAFNDTGLKAVGKAVVFSDNNLLFNTFDYTNVITGPADIVGQDPLLLASNGYLQIGSPAVDRAPTSAPVPAGGGIAADLGWHELRAAPISVFMGQADRSLATESIGVGQVEYGIVQVGDPSLPITATLPTTWTVATLDSPGATLSYWNTSFSPAGDGLYRVYSRASDVLGNRETSIDEWYDGAFVVDSNAPVVTLDTMVGTGFVDPINNPLGLPNNWMLMEGTVVDYIGTSFDIEEIYFTLDGERIEGEWVVEQWTADGSSPRRFTYLFQNNTGTDFNDVPVQAFAVDGAGNIGSSSILTETILGEGSGAFPWIDVLPPYYITVTQPAAGDFVTGTVTFAGVAWDISAYFCSIGTLVCDEWATDSGTSGIELSFDSGVTWQAADSQFPTGASGFWDREWSYDWTVPDGYDGVTVPVRVRAVDYAGNFRSEIITVTIDTSPPRWVGPYTFNYPLGQYVTDDDIIVTYPTTLDGSGWVTSVTPLFNEDGLVAAILPDGDTFADLGSNEGAPIGLITGFVDEQENIIYTRLGDWYVERGISSMRPLGDMEIELQEWITATEYLDTDYRPDQPQSLWLTWDSYRAGVGWQGASWGPDGQGWLYFDTQIGGTTQPVSGAFTLPFAADGALVALSAYPEIIEETPFVFDEEDYPNPEYGEIWIYNNGSEQWEFLYGVALPTTANLQLSQASYGHDADSGVSEFFLEEILVGDNYDFIEDWPFHRMIAFNTDADGNIQSAFPTANELDGNFSHYYEWTDISRPGVDTAYTWSLPIGSRLPYVATALDSNPVPQDPVSAGETVEYLVDINNLDEQDVATGLSLGISGSSGVTFQTVAGADSFDCSADSSCTATVPTITAGNTQRVTVTAVLAADLTGIGMITSTVAISSADSLLLAGTTQTIVHKTDNDLPTTETERLPGDVIGTGPQTLGGTADDGDGSGIAKVEVSRDNSTWKTAEGAEVWSRVITVTESAHGTIETVYVRATDRNGQVGATEVVTFVVDTIAPIITPTVPLLIGGAATYNLEGMVQDPAPANGEVAVVTVQVNDGDFKSGLVSSPDANGEQAWRYAWTLPPVDGVTHTIRVTAFDYANNYTLSGVYSTVVDTVAPVLNITLQFTEIGQGSSTPILGGTVTDGVAVDSLTVTVYPSTGAPTVITPTLTDGSWAIDMSSYALGDYELLVEATDTAGNVRTAGLFPVTIGAQTCYNQQVYARWNLISIPVDAADTSVAALFPDLTNLVFEYDNGYIAVTELEPGKSYWAKFDTSSSYIICGQPPSAGTTISVTAGWNLVGGFENTVDVASINATPGAIESPFYRYDNNGYFGATTLQPGQGYWVKVSASGTLSWPTSLAAPVSRSGDLMLVPNSSFATSSAGPGRLRPTDRVGSLAAPPLVFDRNAPGGAPPARSGQKEGWRRDQQALLTERSHPVLGRRSRPVGGDYEFATNIDLSPD